MLKSSVAYRSYSPWIVIRLKKLGGGGGGGGLVIGITYYLQNNFQSFWAVKIFTFKFYEYSISFIYSTYIIKNKLLQPFSQKVTNTI